MPRNAWVSTFNVERIGVREGRVPKRSKKHSELPGLMWTNRLWKRNYHQQTLALGFQEPTGQKSKHSLQAKTRSGCRGLKSLWKINQTALPHRKLVCLEEQTQALLGSDFRITEPPELKVAHKDHGVQLLVLHKRPQESHRVLSKRAWCCHTIFNATVGTGLQISAHFHIL